MERKMWTLLAIAAGHETGLTPVQLQKTLFLLGKNCKDVIDEDFYQFVPYDYGPFDVAVYDDAQECAEEGLIVRRTVPGRTWRDFCMTPAGRKKVDSLKESMPEVAAAYLDAVVTWAQELTFSQLVTAIYKEYPEMAENSVFSTGVS